MINQSNIYIPVGYELRVPRTRDGINFDYDIRNYHMLLLNEEKYKQNETLLLNIHLILYATNQDKTYNSSKN